MEFFDNDWDRALAPLLDGPAFCALMERVEAAYRAAPVFPPRESLFRAFALTPFASVRAVILGQDPYHTPGVADGLAFSAAPGEKIPPSLRNIFRELSDDCGIPPPASGDLSRWAKNGVLLLNTALTVEAGRANSHQKLGWFLLTDAVLDAINARSEPAVFLLWGGPARAKKARLTAPRHLILEAAHPSPLSASRGFFGCRHFSAAAAFLKQFGPPLDWNPTDPGKE